MDLHYINTLDINTYSYMAYKKIDTNFYKSVPILLYNYLSN